MANDRPKIDVRIKVREIEREMRTTNDPSRLCELIAVLRRWQYDEMLDDESRYKARQLVAEFGLLWPRHGHP